MEERICQHLAVLYRKKWGSLFEGFMGKWKKKDRIRPPTSGFLKFNLDTAARGKLGSALMREILQNDCGVVTQNCLQQGLWAVIQPEVCIWRTAGAQKQMSRINDDKGSLKYFQHFTLSLHNCVKLLSSLHFFGV